MIYRRFGRTELSMPVLTSGAMRFQQSWENLDWEKIEDKNQENLERVVQYEFEHGMNHFETARGYGSSEIQLGRALKSLPRAEIILQTKISASLGKEDFEKLLQTSFEKLEVEYLDLCSLHGINNAASVENIPNCLEVLQRWQRQGKIRYIGFSSHDKGKYVKAAIETDCFDYVNLHYYYISQENYANIALAKEHDMGVLIISPNDKGGKLYAPSPKLCQLTAPFSPMRFNALFCLLHQDIHTISIGASCPEDLHEHLGSVDYLAENKIANTKTQIQQITDKLDQAMRDALGSDWLENWRCGLPDYQQVPDEINITNIIWLYNLAKGLDMLEYGKMRYNLLGNGGSWFPGNKAGKATEFATQIRDLCRRHGSPFADRIPEVLAEAHAMLNTDKVETGR